MSVRPIVAGLASLALAGCKGERAALPPPPTPTPTSTDAAPPPPPVDPWPELAELPGVEPSRRLTLPTDGRRPRLSVVGPVVVGEVAVVGGSQLGFTAIELGSGELRWTLPTGLRAVTPLRWGDELLLVDDCAEAPTVIATDRVLGCYRIVSADGAVVAAGTVVGARGDIDVFAGARGDSFLVADGAPGVVRWQRGDAAVTFAVDDGRARASAARPRTVRATWRERSWDLGLEDEVLVARAPDGAVAWRIDATTAAVLGVIPAAGHEAPMVRVARIGGLSGRGMVGVLDVDATGSRHGQAAFPLPGISILASAMADDGTTALATRVDASLSRDVVALLDRRGAVAWVWPLPHREHVEPLGVAVADEVVLVFHDGDQLTWLPRPPR
ncbi:MAG: hypothetical protein R2939_08295 [Kofleriaceae bacterium]